MPTLICLAAGVLLLLIELFTPGFGVAGGLGLLLLAAVVVMQLLFGSPAVAAYIAAAVLVLIVAALLLFIRSFQRGKLSRSFAVLDEQIDAGLHLALRRERAAERRQARRFRHAAQARRHRGV